MTKSAWERDPKVRKLTEQLNQTKDPHIRWLIQQVLDGIAEDWTQAREEGRR